MAKKKSYDAYVRQQLGDLINQLQLSSFEKQSLKERWLEQMIWADKKASENRRSYYRLRLTTVVGGVILPALVGISLQLGQNSTFFRVWFPPLTFALSQVIAVSVAIEEFCKFGDRWRDYRQMAEDLKSEGWHYLQSSGSYEASSLDQQSFTHQQSFSQFTNRVESIIKNDVESYISNLMKQQAEQEADTQKILTQAQSVSQDQNLLGQMNPNYQSFNNPPTNLPAPDPGAHNGAPNNVHYVHYSAAATPNQLSPDPYQTAPISVSGNGQPPSIAPETADASAPLVPTQIAATASQPTPSVSGNGQLPSIAPETADASAPLVPTQITATASQPAADLNAAILSAALKLKGMSTNDGPDGGNNACAWTLNKVLREANIPSLGNNPLYVPSLLEDLQAGRGQRVPQQSTKAGDLVIAYGEAHIGISLNDGCKTVLSNSSSRARLCWESDVNYDGSYGGPSTVYRLLR